jgi:hypothetical protein
MHEHLAAKQGSRRDLRFPRPGLRAIVHPPLGSISTLWEWNDEYMNIEKCTHGLAEPRAKGEGGASLWLFGVHCRHVLATYR